MQATASTQTERLRANAECQTYNVEPDYENLRGRGTGRRGERSRERRETREERRESKAAREERREERERWKFDRSELYQQNYQIRKFNNIRHCFFYETSYSFDEDFLFFFPFFWVIGVSKKRTSW